MNRSENVETDSVAHVAHTTSDSEAAENEYQPTILTATFHYFLKLPPEIRIQIYDDVARTAFQKTGSLDLFKTSKLIRNEGVAASARHPGFQLWLGWWGSVLTAGPSMTNLGSKATGLIQNVFLEINLEGMQVDRKTTPRPFDCKQIEYFGGSEVMREFCKVDLYYGFKGYLSQDCASSLLFKALRKLTGFRLVTVHVDCEQNQRILTTDDNRIMMISNTRNVDLYIVSIKTALEPTLGPATWRKMSRIYGESQELVFRPFEWKQSAAHRSTFGLGVRNPHEGQTIGSS